MIDLGPFESFRDHHRRLVHVVSVARRRGEAGDGRWVIKSCTPSAFSSPTQVTGRIRDFVEQAKTQREVARARPAHWVAVAEVGETRQEAAYVAERLDFHAGQLIGLRVPLDDYAIYRIIKGIILGLIDLRDERRRSHGNLKPSNVLINLTRRGRVHRVALTDPLPQRRLDQGQLWHADLFAVGEILHDLVTHPGHSAAVAFPVEFAPAWKRLGRRRGERWHALCNILLAPEGQGPAVDLDEAHRLVLRLKPPPRTVRVAVRASPVVAAVLLGLVLFRDYLPTETVDSALVDKVNAGVERYGGFREAARGTPPAAVPPERPTRLGQILEPYRALGDGFRPGVKRWRVSPVEKERLERISDIIDRTESGIANLRSQLRREPKRSSWEELLRTLHLESDPARAANPSVVFDPLTYFETVQTVSAVVESPDKIHWRRLEDESPPPGGPLNEPGLLKAIQNSLKDYSYLTEDEKEVCNLDACKAQVEGELAHWESLVCNGVPGPTEGDLAKARGIFEEYDRLGQRLEDAVRMEQVELADWACDLMNTCEDHSASLATQVGERGKDWLGERKDAERRAQSRPLGEREVTRAWAENRLSALDGIDPTKFNPANENKPGPALQGVVDALIDAEETLTRLDKPTFDCRDAEDARKGEADSVVSRLFEPADAPPIDQPDREEAIGAALKNYEEWIAEVKTQLDRIEDMSWALKEGYLLDEAIESNGGGKSLKDLDLRLRDNASFFAAVDGCNFSTLEEQIGKLEKMKALTSGEAEAQAEDSANTLGVARAAWLRFVEREALGGKVELDRERRLNESVTARVSTDLSRHDFLTGKLTEELKQRWFGYAGAARDETEFEGVAQEHFKYGVHVDEIPEEQKEIWYNMHLHDIKQAAFKDGESEVSRSQKVRDRVVDLRSRKWLSDKQRNDLEGIYQKASRRYGDIGPGKTGWMFKDPPDEDGDDGDLILTYTWSHEGRDHTLSFRAVDSGSANDSHDCFICTDEMPVDLFRDLIDAAGAWKEVRELLHDSVEVRTWTGSGGIEPAQCWFGNPKDLAPDYYGAGRAPPDPPSWTHPIQGIPASAAIYVARLMGCDLPTVDEWTDASNKWAADALMGGCADEGDPPKPVPNLRDASWARLLDTVIANRPNDVRGIDYPYPDSGCFGVPEELKRDKARKGVPWNDGSIWFTPTVHGQRIVRNLIGNVSEYVYAESENGPPGAGPRDMVSGSTPLEIHIGLAPQPVRVIGGSALSDCQAAPFAEPQAYAPAMVLGSRIMRQENLADVGFRVAIVANSVTKEMATVLMPPPYWLAAAPAPAVP